ncbi:hypothetical protein [Piscinibacter gummiphilus]|uniref:RNA polymerase sigma-70 region 2 domain-containing protein n=1 Tax=Piscinibacter gummiphilus TaxID=946333 RepID=A0ABZ0CWK4_9BURK|nr:hypothetical protein [Piscinibacter gummiphilus]WOB07243.1 hypothetical protein RXV79_20275 [Piscinibacter gummiphilus]
MPTLDRRFDRHLLQLAAVNRAHALRDETLDAAWLGLRRAVVRAVRVPLRWWRAGRPSRSSASSAAHPHCA